MRFNSVVPICRRVAWLILLVLLTKQGLAADKLLGIHSARTMSQSMPWIAEEAGLSKKYDLDFQLVYISSASMVNAAMLSGSGDVAITGGESVIRTAAQGVNELVFIAAAKNILTRGPAIEKFVRAMTEAVNIMFTDKELTYKVLGKQLRISDRKVLDAAYDEEIKVMEPHMQFRMESLQAILDETAKTDPRARKLKPQDVTDQSFLEKMEKSGFFDKLRAGK